MRSVCTNLNATSRGPQWQATASASGAQQQAGRARSEGGAVRPGPVAPAAGQSPIMPPTSGPPGRGGRGPLPQPRRAQAPALPVGAVSGRHLPRLKRPAGLSRLSSVSCLRSQCQWHLLSFPCSQKPRSPPLDPRAGVAWFSSYSARSSVTPHCTFNDGLGSGVRGH